MELRRKLQLRGAQYLVCVDLPESLAAILGDDGPRSGEASDDALLVFVLDRGGLEQKRERVVASAAADRLTWVAYPKAGQLGTDLHRDSLAGALQEHGVQPVRHVALDDLWSALRFRPALTVGPERVRKGARLGFRRTGWAAPHRGTLTDLIERTS